MCSTWQEVHQHSLTLCNMISTRWRQSSKQPSVHTWKKKHDRTECCSCALQILKMNRVFGTSGTVLFLSNSQPTFSLRSRSDTSCCKPATCSERFRTRCCSLGPPSWVLIVRPAPTVDAVPLCCFHRVYEPLWVSRHSGMPTGYHRDCEQVSPLQPQHTLPI